MRCQRGGESKSLHGQRGFSLLETVLAVFLIATVGIGIIRAIDTNARASRVLDEQVQAVNLATAYLENMRQLGYDDGSLNPYSTMGAGVTLPPQYSVAVKVEYSPDGATWATTNNTGTYKLQRITISVSRTSGKLISSTCTFRAKR